MITVKIYLNDGEDHFFGFKNSFANSPELTMVMSFDLDSPEPGADLKRWNNFVLEMCFEEFNIGETSEVAKRYREMQLRSLSVGDVVQIGETAWSCESVGWTTITTEELQNAIIWDDERAINGKLNFG